MTVSNKLTILGIPNILANGSGFVGDGGDTTTPANDLGREEPSQLTLAPTSPNPFNAIWCGVTSQYGTSCDAVAAINHNWGRRSGARWRVWTTTGTPLAFVTGDFLEQIAPDSIDGSANATGAVTTVDDDPWLPGSDYITPTVTTDPMTVLLGFPTPSHALVAGTDMEAFVVYARIPVSLGSGTVTLKLYESGVAKATLATVTLDNASGTATQIVVGYWNKSQLSTASGANAQLQIETTGNVRIYAAQWVASSGSIAAAYDSGWIQVKQEGAALGNTYPSFVGVEPMKSEIHYLPSTKTNVEKVLVAALNPDINVAQSQLGCLVAGMKWQPEYSFRPGGLLQVIDPSTLGETLGGQDYGSNQRRRRQATVLTPVLWSDEMAMVMDRIDWRKGTRGAFFVSLFPENANADLDRLTSWWSTLASIDGFSPIIVNGRTAWSRQFTFREKL